MRPIGGTLALLVGALVLVASQVVNAPPTRAAPQQLPLEVAEQNLDLAGRIQVSLPNVDENGRLLVVPPEPDPPQPYQMSVQGFSDADKVACRDLPVPDGQRLELRFVAIKMEAVDSSNHVDYLTGRLRARSDAIPGYVRDVSIPMTFNGIPYEPGQGSYWKEGSADVLMFKDGGDPDTKLQLCVLNDSGTLIGVTFSGIATGWLHDQ